MDRCEAGEWRQIEEVLNASIGSEVPSATTLGRIHQSLAADLRPVRPIRSARVLFGFFAAVFIGIVGLAVYRLGALALGAMTHFQAGIVLVALASGTGCVGWSLVQQMVPGTRYRISPRDLLIAVALSLAAVIAADFRFGLDPDFWQGALTCIKAGGPTAMLVALPAWLVLRRGAVLSPKLTGAATGFFAGLAGTAMLELHCPNTHAGHILVAHLGLAGLGAAAGFLTGLAAQSIGDISRG